MEVEKVNAGIWKISVGKPDKVNLLSELNIAPRTEAILEMGEAFMPVSVEDLEFKVVWD